MKINTYTVLGEIIEGFNLNQMEYNENLDAEDIEALALFLDFPAFASKFPSLGPEEKKKKAKDLEEQLDNKFGALENKYENKINEARNNREDALEKIEEGIVKLSKERREHKKINPVSKDNAKEFVGKVKRRGEDWSVSEPFPQDELESMVGPASRYL
jgi:hypothetical protein